MKGDYFTCFKNLYGLTRTWVSTNEKLSLLKFRTNWSLQYSFTKIYIFHHLDIRQCEYSYFLKYHTIYIFILTLKSTGTFRKPFSIFYEQRLTSYATLIFINVQWFWQQKHVLLFSCYKIQKLLTIPSIIYDKYMCTRMVF